MKLNYIKLYENMNDNKVVRHMTLSEYKTEVVPLIMELKKILRKKYLKLVDYYGLTYLPYEEYVNYKTEIGLKRTKKLGYGLDEDYHRKSAESSWGASKLKTDPIPTDLYNRYKEIEEQLTTFFGEDALKFDISKAHKDNKPVIRRCISDDTYINEIKNGELDFETLESICSSLGVRVPKRVLELKDMYSGSSYQRAEFTRTNEEFTKSIRNILSPFTDEIKEKKEREYRISIKILSRIRKKII